MKLGAKVQTSFQAFLLPGKYFGFRYLANILDLDTSFGCSSTFYSIYLKPAFHSKSLSKSGYLLQILPPKSFLSEFAFMVEILKITGFSFLERNQSA